MKRIIAMAMAAVALTVSFVSCGKDKYIGVYEYAGIDSDVEVPAEDKEIYDICGNSMNLELCEDEKLIMTDDGVDLEGEWEVKGEELRISADGGENTLKIKDGKIFLEYGEGVSLVFEKK